jgi:hypothetical protein
MVLGIDQLGIFGGGIVKNLQFHPGTGRSSLARVMNAEAVVTTGREQKFELEDVIGVLFFGYKVSALTNDCPVLDYVVTALPSGQVLPVKEGNRFGCGQEKRT